MDAEKRHIAEIKRVEAAIKKTDSPMLKNDYTKYLHSLKRELREYRRFRKEAQC